MNSNDLDKKARNLRFTKDYSLPINIFSEDLFSYYREIYSDFWPTREELMMYEEIESCGGIQEWLQNYGRLRDRIIEDMENRQEYKNFLAMDMSCYESIPENLPSDRSLYTQEIKETDVFLSVDLKKANFQALKYVGVIDENTYEEFIKSFGGSEYLAGSKYLRQVIFGKLNPKRQIKVEKWMITKISQVGDFDVFSVNSDEIIFKLRGSFGPTSNIPSTEVINIIPQNYKTFWGVDVRAELIGIKRLPIINSSGATVDAYIRRNLITGEEQLKKASSLFYPQIYKLWKGRKIEERDLMFYFEDQLAQFKEPLRLEI